MKSHNIMNIQSKIFNLFPKALQNLSDIRFSLSYLLWRVQSNGFRHSSKILSPLHNKYNGCRCVILGNGPSLRKMDLGLLRNEFTFGLNRIYLLFGAMGFETTFLVAVNRTVLNQFSDEILKTNALKLLNWSHRGSIIPNKETAFICVKPWKGVDGDILHGYSGSIGTVTTAAIETAFFMGFSEVILIGVDHSYVEKGIPGFTIISKEADQNHFDPNYFGKGVTWQLPDLIASESGYLKAKSLFERHGKRIVDATREGKLEIFPKGNLEEILETSEFLNKVGFEHKMNAHSLE